MKNYLTLSEKIYSHVENIDKSLLQTEVRLDYIGQANAQGESIRSILDKVVSKGGIEAYGNKLAMDISYVNNTIYMYTTGEVTSANILAEVGLYTGTIKVPEYARKKDFAEQHLNGVMPKRYGCKADGTMTTEGLVKWLYHSMLKPYKMPEKYLKEWLEKLKETTYYLYAVKNAMPEVACLIAERTNTRSCMTSNGLMEAFYQFRYTTTNEDGQVVWLHPFRAYEGLEGSINCMMCVSTLPPEKVLGQTHDKIPFIARGFSDRKSCARWYGSSEQKWSDLFENYVDSDTPWGMTLYAYEQQGEHIAPYVDGGCDANDNYLNALTRLGSRDAEDTPYKIKAWTVEMYDRYEDEEDETDGFWKIDVGNARMFFYEPVVYHVCAISGEEYSEDEMIYVEDLDAWVEDRFARYDEGRGYHVLDGLELYNYYN